MDYDPDSSSSELSSLASLSPPPPDFGIPTPPGSQGYDGYSTPSSRSDANLTTSADDKRPARKRRKIEPKPRTTKHLHLSIQSGPSEERKEAYDLLEKTLRNRSKIVVIAGAGISVSAGIPDFRSSGGLFKSLKSEHKLKASGKQLFDASVYKNDDSTSSFHDMVRQLSSLAASAKPTAFHHLLARLAKDGRLLRLYTQNVDGLESSLPPLATRVPIPVRAPWPVTIQLHGGLEKMVCQKCNETTDFQPSLFQGPKPPLCGTCTENDSVRDVAGKRSHGVGKLRPRIVLYNEYNPDEEAIGSVVTSDLRTRPDALIVVGTSLKIPGVRRIVREMCTVVRGRKHGVTVWINNDMVPVGKDFEDCWDLIVKGDSDYVAKIAGLRHWDDDCTDAVEECTASDVERTKEQNGVPDVVVMTPKKEKVPVEKIASGPQDQVVIDPTAKPTKNPASKGRSIANLLGKDKETGSKVKIKRNKNAPKPKNPATNRGTINFPVTKLAKQEASQKKNPEYTESSLAPLSPSAARNNGPLRNNGPMLFPNLVSEISKDSSPPRPWKDKTIVSPKGSVSPHFRMILNFKKDEGA